MAPDSPVAAGFIPAPDHWSRSGAEVRAIVIHMAEGGGTVSWLTRLDGNSSHYVVEYSGRVIQMVRESEAAGSMNPKLTRTSNDAPYSFMGETITYGRTALDAAGIAHDPNRYAIAVEVEGFAADGPNTLQAQGLARLVADIRSRRGAYLHVLGHRDQQSYKPCPGHKMPWALFGGHGAPHPEADMALKPITTTIPRLIDWPDDTPYYQLDGVTRAGVAAADSGRYSPYGCGTMRAFYRGDKQLALVTPSAIHDVPVSVDTTPDPAQLEAARKEGRESMQHEAVAAVGAIVP